VETIEFERFAANSLKVVEVDPDPEFQ